MRIRLSVAGYVLTAAVAVAGIGVGAGVSRASTGHDGAAAGGCGRHCFLLYARRPGQAFTMNVAIAANNGTGGRVGRKINLAVGGRPRARR